MDQAKELFNKIQSITTDIEFIEYCSEVLGAVERIHVDFKEKQDRRNAKLEDNDKKNLAKAVSGFANSGGGVLIWGLKDETLEPKPIKDIRNFIQNLLEIAPQTTDPVVGNIDGYWVISSENQNEGYGILLIPESPLPPHRAILNLEGFKNHYFVRSGNSFVVASHTMLEDMFGRRPKPDLSLSISFKHSGSLGVDQQWFTIILGIENSGRGVAKSPFLEININPPFEIANSGIDGNGSFGMPKIASSGDIRGQRYGSTQTLVIHSGIIHYVTAIRLELFISTAKALPDVIIDYKIAAEGIQTVTGKKIVKIAEILSSFGYQIN
jgi:hypothetical protein